MAAAKRITALSGDHRPTHYLAFDLGASSSRAVLGTLVDDAMRLKELHRFTTPILERGDHLLWDLDVLWDELQTGLQKALDVAPDLRSLSVDSWAVDYVPLDTDGVPLRNPYCYRDPRTDGVMASAFETLPAETIYAHTGIQFLPFNTLYQVLADEQRDPQALRRVRQHLTVADYFNYRFSGQGVIEVSMASTTQLMDVHIRQWSDPLMRAFGLDPNQWPLIVPSGTRLGRVLVAPGVTAVATCSHDTGCAVAAIPLAEPHTNWAYISCGTWSLFGVERQTPVLTDEAREAGFTHEAGIDGTIRLLKNLTGLWAMQECAREWRERGLPVDWSTLEEEARAAAPYQAFIDLEDPRFLPRGGMEERLRAYCREYGLEVPTSRGRLVRAILESIAESYRRALTDLQRLTGQTFEVIHLVGGGSQNSLLCQLTADATQSSVIAGPVEATALGNLLIQARTMGDLPGGLTIRDMAARSSRPHTYEPNFQTA